MMEFRKQLQDWFGTTPFTVGNTPVNMLGVFRAIIDPA